MAIVINGQTGIDAGHLPISNAGNTEIEGTLTGADVTVASITANSVITQGQNVTPFSGFKNYIINGNFDVWQYGTSQTSHSYGSDDRWINGGVGSTKTHSRISCTDVERALFNANYFSRTVVTSVAGAGNVVYKQQKIEDVTRLAGKTVTLSFWAKADTAKNIAIDFNQSFGTGGTPSSVVNGLSPTTIPLTTTWQKKTVTLTLPSTVGKTLGTDGPHTSFTYFEFWFDAGSINNARTNSLGQQSGTFDIAQVQLEEGSVDTPFENRPYGLELSLCQRYMRPLPRIWAITQSTARTYNNHTFTFPTMRVQPSIVGATFGVDSGNAGTVSTDSISNGSIQFVNSASNWTVGIGAWIASGYLSAEL